MNKSFLHRFALSGVIYMSLGAILLAAAPTPGTLITDLPVPLVVEGKTVGSITLKAGTQVSVISILPNNGGVVIARGEGSPFIVAKTALTQESILLAIAAASATPTPAPTPLAVANPAQTAIAKPSPSTSSSNNQTGSSDEADFMTTINDGIVTIARYTGNRENLVIPNTIDGVPVGVIGHGAFQDSKIISVVIPDSVTKIERKSFLYCRKLTKITLPKNLEECEDLGGNPNLKLITLDPGNQNFTVDADGVLFNTAKSRLLAYPAAKKDSRYTIPSTVTEIGAFAFGGCKNLLVVDLPESLIKIGNDAFNGAEIRSIAIPNTVTTIDNFAFRYCCNLSNASIGKGIVDFGGGVFVKCEKLQKAQFEGNAPLIKGNNTFIGTASNFKVYYHASAEGFSSPMWTDSGGGRWKSMPIQN